MCSGIKVDKVHPKDLFALAGIKAGMVITSVNGTAVYDHESAMDMMKEAKGNEKKLAIEYLTEEGAKELGAIEWQSSKKWIVCIGLVLVALIALAAAYVKYNGGLAAVLGVDPSAVSKAPGGGNMNMMDEMMKGAGADPEKMKQSIEAMKEKYMTPEMKEKINSMGGMGIGGMGGAKSS